MDDTVEKLVELVEDQRDALEELNGEKRSLIEQMAILRGKLHTSETMYRLACIRAEGGGKCMTDRTFFDDQVSHQLYCILDERDDLADYWFEVECQEYLAFWDELEEGE